jgi:hypothetical protein
MKVPLLLLLLVAMTSLCRTEQTDLHQRMRSEAMATFEARCAQGDENGCLSNRISYYGVDFSTKHGVCVAYEMAIGTSLPEEKLFCEGHFPDNETQIAWMRKELSFEVGKYCLIYWHGEESDSPLCAPDAVEKIKVGQLCFGHQLLVRPRKTRFTVCGEYPVNALKPPEETENRPKEIEAPNDPSKTKMLVQRTFTTKVEGFWATDADPTKDRYRGRYPWPQKSETGWPGKEEFVRKLHRIQNTAGTSLSPGDSRVRYYPYQGHEESRLAPGEFLSTSIYEYISPGHEVSIVWPCEFLDHYVEKFNVKPSDEFIDFVNSYPNLASKQPSTSV